MDLAFNNSFYLKNVDVAVTAWYVEDMAEAAPQPEIDHLAIVVDKAPGDYPEVAEWSALDGTTPTPYSARGWTYSVRHRTWLQEKYPHITANLIRVDTSRKIRISIGSTG